MDYSVYLLKATAHDNFETEVCPRFLDIYSNINFIFIKNFLHDIVSV